jgi:tRNA-dihydrouridine synthase A
MMDWTDRHCRFFHRLLTAHALLYTEMVTAEAVLHGDRDRLLGFSPEEHPVALQLGGSDPGRLAEAAAIGADYGYDEINLNVGCPSDRVQEGRFGACLMAEPELVADCVRAMQDAAGLPVSVKHRLGVDRVEDYSFVRRFVETLARAGCGIFIVHARNAVLRGLSPKQNREVPALRHAEVHRLKREFPQLTIVLNGGLHCADDIDRHLGLLDGVMLGRAAYHDPWFLACTDARLWGRQPPTRAALVRNLARYAQAQVDAGTPLRAVSRHLLGLFHGQPRARIWRRMLSDAAAPSHGNARLLIDALEAVEPVQLAA